MIPYSLLDLCPVPEGATVREALGNTLALAPVAERLGYHRYWLAEHHNMKGIASAATSVVIGQVPRRPKPCGSVLAVSCCRTIRRWS